MNFLDAFPCLPNFARIWKFLPRICSDGVAMTSQDNILTIPNVVSLLKVADKTVHSLIQKGDLPGFKVGFRVFKFYSSNVRAWESDRDALDATLLESIEHLKPDRSEEDILYELLLKLGLDLCVPIEAWTIAGSSVRSIGTGTLMACLAERINRNDIESLALEIAEWHDELAPAGDSTFADDVAKTNLKAILQQRALENVRSL